MDQSNQKHAEEPIIINKYLSLWEALIPIIVLIAILAYNVYIYESDGVNIRFIEKRNIDKYCEGKESCDDKAGKIEKIWPKVKVDGHTDEVMAHLKGQKKAA